MLDAQKKLNKFAKEYLKKPLTPHAACAKAIRAELKKAFPSVKFSVTSESFSMGNAVRVSWTDGKTTDQVNAIIKKYQYGTFDGMTDSYDYTNNRDDIPQAKYVQTSRDYSESTTLMVWEYLKSYFKIDDMPLDQSSHELNDRFGCWTPRNMCYRRMVKMDLTQGLIDQLEKTKGVI